MCLVATVPSDPWGMGFTSAFIGIAVVLGALIVLVLLLYLISFIIKQLEKISNKCNNNSNQSCAVETQSAINSYDVSNENETVAAITAAIACVYASEGQPNTKFKVRQIKKV